MAPSRRSLTDEIAAIATLVGERLSSIRGLDLLVEAIAKETGERAAVVIEVKGCWNRELNTSMGQQLVGRYLATDESAAGLYLVGWYLCDDWDREDYRRTGTPDWELARPREQFRTQAREHSSPGRRLEAIVLDARIG